MHASPPYPKAKGTAAAAAPAGWVALYCSPTEEEQQLSG